MSSRRSEAGFTLIELLISLVLLGIIIVPITGAMIDGLTATTDAQARLNESRSPLFSSAYFADDAQSADSTGVDVGGSSPRCGSGTSVVSFTWTEVPASGSPTQYSASYVIVAAGSGSALSRNFCQNGGQIRSFT